MNGRIEQNREHSGELSPNVLNVSFGVSGKQIWSLIAAIASIVPGAIAAGWLFLPAKQSDLVELRQIVVTIQQEMKTTRDTTDSLTRAVSELTTTVKDWSARTVQARPRAARPAPKAKGMFE